MKQKVGFIGLGNMGFPMVKNLMKYGYKVCGFDVDKQKEQELLEIGGEVGHTYKSLTKEVDIILSILPTQEIVKSVYLGEEGLVASSAYNSMLVDLITSSPELVREIGKTAKENQVQYLGTPVSGSVSGAEAASLSI